MLERLRKESISDLDHTVFRQGAIVGLVCGILIWVFEFGVNSASPWFKLFGGFGLVTVGIPLLCRPGHPRVLLHIFAFTFTSTVFFLVNTSGGMTGSPFVSFYAIILTGALIVARKTWSKRLAGGWVVVFLVLNGLAEYQNWGAIVDDMTPGKGPWYFVKYTLVVVGVLVVGGWSQNRYSQPSKTKTNGP